jgi:acyl-CoA synthetase (NDP forming)
MTVLSAAAGEALLAEYRLPLVPQRVAGTADEAVAHAVALGLPVAMKLLAEGVSHKSDVGGVRLGLGEREDVRRTAGELLEIGRKVTGSPVALLVQPMVSGVAELIVGIAQDPTFGPVVAVGLGGILTELFEDVAIGIPPLSRADASALLGQVRASVLLDGYRGQSRADREAVIDLIVTVSRIAIDGKVLELDLNPVIVRAQGEGCVIVDNRVVLREEDSASASPHPEEAASPTARG